MITIIAAIGKNNELGKDNKLLWKLPKDLKTGSTVVMGRKTFESIGKPLFNRDNIVITRSKEFDRCAKSDDINFVMNTMNMFEEDNIFIIGGAQIYKQALESNYVDELDITLVDGEFDADVFFPEIDLNIWREYKRTEIPKDQENKYNTTIIKYKRKK